MPTDVTVDNLNALANKALAEVSGLFFHLVLYFDQQFCLVFFKELTVRDFQKYGIPSIGSCFIHVFEIFKSVFCFTDDQFEPVVFDFLISSTILRTTLKEFVQENHVPVVSLCAENGSQ